MNAAKLAAAQDKKAQLAMEQKINDETEREGLAAEKVVESCAKLEKVQ
jgi:hypothetical protein